MSLMPSDRHTNKDLELWEAYKEADGVISNDPRFVKAIDKAVALVKDCWERKQCGYLGVSWGKDSVVTAHLNYLAGNDFPLLHIYWHPNESPYADAVASEFCSRYKPKYHQWMLDCSDTLAIAGKATWEEQDKETDRRLHRLFREAEHQFGQYHLSGVRSAESAGRKIRMRRWGLESQNACAPIGHWPTKWVFAYLAKYDLPIHPNYAMTGGGFWDRERLRVDQIAGVGGTNMGRLEWEKMYYPDILSRLQCNQMEQR